VQVLFAEETAGPAGLVVLEESHHREKEVDLPVGTLAEEARTILEELHTAFLGSQGLEDLHGPIDLEVVDRIAGDIERAGGIDGDLVVLD
jgi:hypothetical protein